MGSAGRPRPPHCVMASARRRPGSARRRRVPSGETWPMGNEPQIRLLRAWDEPNQPDSSSRRGTSRFTSTGCPATCGWQWKRQRLALGPATEAEAFDPRPSSRGPALGSVSPYEAPVRDFNSDGSIGNRDDGRPGGAGPLSVSEGDCTDVRRRVHSSTRGVDLHDPTLPLMAGPSPEVGVDAQ